MVDVTASVESDLGAQAFQVSNSSSCPSYPSFQKKKKKKIVNLSKKRLSRKTGQGQGIGGETDIKYQAYAETSLGVKTYVVTPAEL